MPQPPIRDVKQFIQASVVLHVPDAKTAAEHYRDALGFTFDFAMDDYAVVWRENAAVHFYKGKAKPSGVHLFFWVQDVDAVFEEIKDRVAAIVGEPATQPYGIRESCVKDLHDVPLVFGQDAEEPQ